MEFIGKDFCDKCNGDTIGIINYEYSDGCVYYIDIEISPDKESNRPCKCEKKKKLENNV